MADKTGIAWTDATWNPTTGCSKVSAGCKNCYAEREWARLSANPGSVYFERAFTDVMVHPERLDQPLQWKKPRRVFVNSMSDIWHNDVPLEFIADVYLRMRLAHQHTFQLLTKRPDRRSYWWSELDKWVERKIHVYFDGGEYAYEWPLPNVWEGVSIEDQATADERIPLLLQTPAAVRFLSVEPLLGPVNLTELGHDGDGVIDCLRGEDWIQDWYGDEQTRLIRRVVNRRERIDWVIVGGESGPGARPCNIEWVRDIVRQCKAASVPPFVKQLGANWTNNFVGVHTPTRDRKGADPAEWPEDVRVQEFPAK
jgi:protein gp37